MEERFETIELWCCASCEHEFFAISPSCPKCGFGSYRLLNIVQPKQVAIGSYRVRRFDKKNRSNVEPYVLGDKL